MADKRINPIFVILLIAVGFFVFRNFGFFSIFEDSNYVFVQNLTQGTAKSTHEFGYTRDYIDPVHYPERYYYRNNEVSSENDQVSISGSTGHHSDINFGTTGLEITKTVVKTNYLNISPSNLNKLSFNFNQETSGTIFGSSSPKVSLYLTDGINDLPIYSAGGEDAQHQSGVITITKLNNALFLKINEEPSNLLTIPDGNYEILVYADWGGTVDYDEGPNPISSRITISNIFIERVNITECSPDWACTEWNSCINSNQVRTCTDLNNCGINTDRPLELRSCQLTSSNQSTSQQIPSQQEETEIFNTRNVLIILAIIGAILGIYYWRKR